MRALKLLAFILLSLFAIRLWLARLLSPEAVAERLNAQIREATGLSLTLEQSPRIALLPALALELGAGSLNDFAGRPVLRFTAMSARMAWLRLLQQPVELDALELAGVRVDPIALLLREAPSPIGPPAPPRLPSVRFPVAVRDLRLVDAYGVERLRFHRVLAPPLHERQSWTLHAEGELATEPPVAIALRVTATPVPAASGIDWQDLSLDLGFAGWGRLELSGLLQWQVSSLRWQADGTVALETSLAAAIGTPPGPLRLTSAGTIGFEEGGRGEALLNDRSGREVAKLSWARTGTSEPWLHLALTRLVRHSLELSGIEIERLPHAP